MTLRINLCDDAPPPSDRRPTARPAVRAPLEEARVREPLLADLDDPYVPPLLLYLGDEPEIGRRFHYAGVEWEIVDYDNGWVARLIVG
jgi:hypothetical protein